MALRLQKCEVAHMEKERIQYHGESWIKGTGVVPEVMDKNMYRYLGVDPVFKASHKAVCAKLTKKVAARVDTIWSSSLSAKRKCRQPMSATFRYYLLRPKAESRAIDTKARKIISKYQGHHRCTVQRLHLPRNRGSRGLQSIEKV